MGHFDDFQHSSSHILGAPTFGPEIIACTALMVSNGDYLKVDQWDLLHMYYSQTNEEKTKTKIYV